MNTHATPARLLLLSSSSSNRQAPYPFPATHADHTAPVYNTPNEKNGLVDGKINVHIVPHTHDDTGWQVTVDQYFFTEVYYVVDTVVDQLQKNPKRHFICASLLCLSRLPVYLLSFMPACLLSSVHPSICLSLCET
eukprot:SAG22_NODE_2476_length_2530_cov_2.162896_4_plen_136_part_00